MKCILCNQDSGTNQVCEECRNAFLDYKNKYLATKALTETTKFDKLVFENICKIIDLEEELDNEINGFFPTKCEDVIQEVIPVLRKMLEDNEWINQQPGRMDAFIEYVEKYIRKYYEEHDKNDKE